MTDIQPKSILKDKPLKESMDYAFLKKEGVDAIQKLSGKIWTDYNEHDPGITILENICYALTELGYKTNLPITDILYLKDEEGVEEIDTPLYEVSDIFPCTPLSVIDYRKLIIDRVPSVRNAWLQPLKKSALGLNVKGLYEVLLQVLPDADQQQTVEDVQKLINAHRNLSEDFDQVRILDSQKVEIRAELNIQPNVVGESVIARLLLTLSEIFSPPISFYNLEEMMEKGYEIDEIFDGPAPKSGFIDNKDLEKSELHLINTLYRSRLIQAVSELEGVLEVTNFVILVNGEEVKSEFIQLPAYSYPILDVSNILANADSFLLYAGDIVYNINPDTVQYTYDLLKAREEKKHQRWMDIVAEEGESNKTVEDVKYFYSVQNTFPRDYGISNFGIQGRHSLKRKAQAKQLKGYLLFFEQLMVNYLAQLVKVRKLFSLEEALDQTYFFQGLDTVPEVDPLLGGGKEKFERDLGNLVEKYDNNLDRRNRFLDHLLARFGEEFLDEAYTAIHRESNIYTRDAFARKNINSKLKFLKHFIDISRNRAKGFDYSSTEEAGENATGLKKKLCLLFNIQDYGHRSLSGIVSEKKVSLESSAKPKTAKPKKGQFTFSAQNEDLLSEVLAHGVGRNNYIVDKDGNEFSIQFIHPITKESQKIYSGTSLEDCETALKKLIEKLIQLNKDSEGFHIVEHILLRPVDVRFHIFLFGPTSRLLKNPEPCTELTNCFKNFSEALLTYGLEKKNYSVEKVSDKKYKMVLKGAKGKIIGENDSFVLKKSADEAIQDAIAVLNDVKKNKRDYQTYLETEQLTKKGSVVNGDPYSQQISFIVPSWTGRFQSNKVKALFENIVKINAPAHLKLNFHWVNMYELQGFEKVYEKWLTARAGQNGNASSLDDLSFQLLSMLSSFEAENGKL